MNSTLWVLFPAACCKYQNVLQIDVSWACPEVVHFKIIYNNKKYSCDITKTETEINDIKIINLQGVMIFEKTNISSSISSVDLSTYPKGIYIKSILKNNRQIKYELVLQ